METEGQIRKRTSDIYLPIVNQETEMDTSLGISEQLARSYSHKSFNAA